MSAGTKTVLICPLDWGIGHASRCISLIYLLKEEGWKVVAGADGRPYEFLKKEVPSLDLVRFPGAQVEYPQGAGMVLKMARFIPDFLSGIAQEHRFLKNLAEETGAGLIISDNRYGCWHPEIPSVLITHQLEIQVPSWLAWLRPFISKTNYSLIGSFTERWIPDDEEDGGLAGVLSHPLKLPCRTHYIGLLSRFGYSSEGQAQPIQAIEPGSSLLISAPELRVNPPGPSADIFVLISGPEPQRTLMEKMLLAQIRNSSYSAVIAGGRTEADDHEITDGRIHVFSHLPSCLIRHYMENSEYIICRSGYSTLMDLACVGRPAILIPTPGQTEQEYLARSLSGKGMHTFMSQDEFVLDKALNDFSGCRNSKRPIDPEKIRKRLSTLIQADSR